MPRVTFRLIQRPTERGHADGVGFGVVGGPLTPDDGPIGRRLATNTATITTTETVIAIRIVDRLRESIRPWMVHGFHEPSGARHVGGRTASRIHPSHRSPRKGQGSAKARSAVRPGTALWG